MKTEDLQKSPLKFKLQFLKTVAYTASIWLNRGRESFVSAALWQKLENELESSVPIATKKKPSLETTSNHFSQKLQIMQK